MDINNTYYPIDNHTIVPCNKEEATRPLELARQMANKAQLWAFTYKDIGLEKTEKEIELVNQVFAKLKIGITKRLNETTEKRCFILKIFFRIRNFIVLNSFKKLEAEANFYSNRIIPQLEQIRRNSEQILFDHQLFDKYKHLF